jgi:hypothetical protein
MELLLSFAGCLSIPITAVLVILLAIWVVRLNQQSSKDYNRARQERANALRKKGLTAPAVIISAKNGIVQGSKNNQRMLRTFEVEVQPEGRPFFQTTFKDYVAAGSTYTTWGDRPEDIGKIIWITYNPDDIKEIMFEYYDKDRKYILGRPHFDKLEKRNKIIRETGEEALATILEVEDLELTNIVEREYLFQTIMRLKLEVTQNNGSHYQAETQASFSNASMHKYAVGKKVYVKFNALDKTQVALLRSAE